MKQKDAQVQNKRPVHIQGNRAGVKASLVTVNAELVSDTTVCLSSSHRSLHLDVTDRYTDDLDSGAVTRTHAVTCLQDVAGRQRAGGARVSVGRWEGSGHTHFRNREVIGKKYMKLTGSILEFEKDWMTDFF